MSQGGRSFQSEAITLTLPKELSSVEAARLALLEFVEPFGLGSKVLNRLEVILEELVSNVVRHSREATYVALSVMRSDEGVHMCVEDDGEAFDPLKADAHRPFERVEDAQIGGLGIPLIRRLSRTLDYERRDSLNRICAVVAAE